MALSLGVAFQTAIEAGSGCQAVLFTFEFGSVYGLWTGAGTLTFNSVTYVGAGSILEVGDIQENADGSVEELLLVLNAAPEKGVTPDVLAALYSENWHMRPVTVQIAMLDPATSAVVGVVTKFRGRVEMAPYIEGAQRDRIEAVCKSWSFDMSLAGDLVRNAQIQALLDPNDKSLDGVGTLNGALSKDAYWGQK